MLARASYLKHTSLDAQDLDRSLGGQVQQYAEARQPIRPTGSILASPVAW